MSARPPVRLAAGLDLGGSAVKAWAAEVEPSEAASDVVVASRPVAIIRPGPHLAELDPAVWWAAARGALCEVVARATARAGGPVEWVAVTAASLRQGFVCCDADGELGTGILNGDRRGAGALEELRRGIGSPALYERTGHWLAPELTLPKLMVLARGEPGRWAATRRVRFLADWVLWRLAGRVGADVTGASMAGAGQLLDVARREVATDLLDDVGLGADRLAPLVEAGTMVGVLVEDGLGLPLGTPLVAGGGDTQHAAAGAGGLAEGVATIVAGSSSPVQLAAAGTPPADRLRHPWVSPHLRADLWAVEGNAGYGGTMHAWLGQVTGHDAAALGELLGQSPPGANGLLAVVATPEWSERSWAVKAPASVVGITPAHGPADLARAFVEGHAHALRGNLDDLERVTGRPLAGVVLTGGAAGAPGFAGTVADVTGRTLAVSPGGAATARAGAWLCARAAGADEGPAPRDAERTTTVEPTMAPDEEAHARYLAAFAALRDHLAEPDLVV